MGGCSSFARTRGINSSRANTRHATRTWDDCTEIALKENPRANRGYMCAHSEATSLQLSASQFVFSWKRIVKFCQSHRSICDIFISHCCWLIWAAQVFPFARLARYSCASDWAPLGVMKIPRVYRRSSASPSPKQCETIGGHLQRGLRFLRGFAS